jgi:hypothetical protein
MNHYELHTFFHDKKRILVEIQSEELVFCNSNNAEKNGLPHQNNDDNMGIDKEEALYRLKLHSDLHI